MRAWIAAKGPAFGHFIDGQFTAPGETFATKNPASGETMAEVTQGSAGDVDAAVAAATRAFPKWAKLSGHARAKYLYALARLLQKHARLFAVLESLDNGKPIRETPRYRRAAGAAAFLLPRGPRPTSCRRTTRPRAPRRLRPDHPVELPPPDAGVEDRPRAGRREYRGAEARRIHLVDGPPVSPISAARPGCPRASSTSSPATAPRGRPSSSIPASQRSPLPVPPPWVAASARPRRGRARR